MFINSIWNISSLWRGRKVREYLKMLEFGISKFERYFADIPHKIMAEDFQNVILDLLQRELFVYINWYPWLLLIY